MKFSPHSDFISSVERYMSGWEKEMLMNATTMKSHIYFRIKNSPIQRQNLAKSCD